MIVTGSLGNISRPLVEELVRQGHTVTVISSKADRTKEIQALGAIAAIGSVQDAAFLEKTFTGADAAYCMTPPDFGAADVLEYYRSVADSYSEAAKNTGIEHLLYLSSYGADLEKGTGVIRGSHYAEGVLSKLRDVTVTLLRPGYFYYNLYAFLGMIKSRGVMGSNFGGDDKLVMVSPLDIAAAAAEELMDAAPKNKVRYIASDEHTCNEVASILGAAIGKPDLQWLTFSGEQVKQSMLERGMHPGMAGLLVELGAAIHTGALLQDYERHRPPLGRVKLQAFAREFAIAYHKS